MWVAWLGVLFGDGWESGWGESFWVCGWVGGYWRFAIASWLWARGREVVMQIPEHFILLEGCSSSGEPILNEDKAPVSVHRQTCSRLHVCGAYFAKRCLHKSGTDSHGALEGWPCSSVATKVIVVNARLVD